MCFSFFCDLLDEPSMHSWNNFGRLAYSGKIHHYSMFCRTFVHCSSLESESLINGFLTFSRLNDVSGFCCSSEFIWTFFGLFQARKELLKCLRFGSRVQILFHSTLSLTLERKWKIPQIKSISCHASSLCLLFLLLHFLFTLSILSKIFSLLSIPSISFI